MNLDYKKDVVLFFACVLLFFSSTTNAQQTTDSTAVISVTETQESPAELPDTAIAPIIFDLPEIKNFGVFIKVTDGCNFAFGGSCLNVRSGPGTNYSVARKLRNDEVLRIDQIVIDGSSIWYRINYDDQFLAYPERIKSNEYVISNYVDPFITERTRTTWEHGGEIGNKKIIVDTSDQNLTAFEGDVLIMQTKVSTGKELTLTDIGEHEIFKKMPSRYMQGPIPDSGLEDVYDLEGVPWTMYFHANGSAIHGAYWHNSFGSPYSHGCVNLKPDDAKILYNWANLGTKVEIRN